MITTYEPRYTLSLDDKEIKILKAILDANKEYFGFCQQFLKAIEDSKKGEE